MNFLFEWAARAKNTIRKIVQAPSRYDKAADDYAFRLAEETVRQVKENIESGMVKPGLDTNTMARKFREGMDPRVLIATRAYIDSMRPAVAEKHSAGVEVNGDKFRMLEYGTKRMPPRPHVLPVARRVRGDVTMRAKFFKDLLGFGEE